MVDPTEDFIGDYMAVEIRPGARDPVYSFIKVAIPIVLFLLGQMSLLRPNHFGGYAGTTPPTREVRLGRHAGSWRSPWRLAPESLLTLADTRKTRALASMRKRITAPAP